MFKISDWYQKWIGIWNFTYSWGSYIFRTTWVNHIEYSCSYFFLCNWKKRSGWKTKESHKNRSSHKSIYMSIHMSLHRIHFFTQYRNFWHVLSIKWINFMFPFYIGMLKISFMYIFLQLKIDKRCLHDDQMGDMAPPTSRTSVLCSERPLSALFLKKL